MLNFIEACWREDKQRRILWLAVLFACGIGGYFLLPFEPNKWITLTVVEILILIAVIFRRHLRLLYYLSAVFVFVIGFAVVQLKSIYMGSSQSDIYNKTSYFKGVISNIDTNYKNKQRFTFDSLEDFEGNVYEGKYRLTMRSDEKPAKIGDCVELVGTIMPAPKETSVGGFQLDRKNYFDGLKGNGYAESSFFSAQCNDVKNSYWSLGIGKLRKKIVQRIEKILPQNQAAIAAAIIAGDKDLISSEQYQQYRNAGLAHFLAISGLHMSMLCGLMFLLVRFILALIPQISLRYDTRKIAALVALGASFIYLIIAGLAVPAMRAFIMIALVLLGVLVNRRAISMYTVALAAGVILLISPEVLVSASFQMSFAAVVGLIAFYEKYSSKIQEYFASGNKFWRGIKIYVLGILITDFVASIATLPYAIYHFNMIAIYTTLGNLAAGPIIGLLIMPCVLICLLLLPLGADKYVMLLLGKGIDWLNHITEFVSALPDAGLYVTSMPFIGLLAITMGGLWLTLWHCQWRMWGVYAIALGFLSIVWMRTPDVIVAENMKAIAFKNNQGELELVSSRGGDFIKQSWRQRYPVSDNVTMLKAHPEFWVEGDIVTIGKQQYNIKDIIGFSAYKKGDDFVVKTIRDDIGLRPWNKE